MPRTREELEKAATDAETWLESLDPSATPAEDPTDLRRIGLALRHLADDQREVIGLLGHDNALLRELAVYGLGLGFVGVVLHAVAVVRPLYRQPTP